MKKNVSIIGKFTRAIAFTAFCLLIAESVNAASFLVDCKVGNGRSSIVVKSTGMRGTFYAQVQSEEGVLPIFSENKKTNRKGVVEFRFDSDLTANPNAQLIAFDFIKKRQVAVVLRKADTNAYKAGAIEKCTAYPKIQSVVQ